MPRACNGSLRYSRIHALTTRAEADSGCVALDLADIMPFLARNSRLTETALQAKGV